MNTQETKENLIALGIGVDDATRRFAGKYDLYIKSLRKFFAGISEENVTSVSTAMEMEPEDLRKYIHGLKGVTANLSVTTINKLLVEIELSIKNGRTDYDKYREFYTSIIDTAGKVNKILSSGEEKAPVLSGGTKEEYRELLITLKHHLMSGRARDCEEAALRLREKEWSGVESNYVSKICDAVDSYDYAKAMELMNNAEGI